MASFQRALAGLWPLPFPSLPQHPSTQRRAWQPFPYKINKLNYLKAPEAICGVLARLRRMAPGPASAHTHPCTPQQSSQGDPSAGHPSGGQSPPCLSLLHRKVSFTVKGRAAPSSRGELGVNQGAFCRGLAGLRAV